jgi:hypothetical protein
MGKSVCFGLILFLFLRGAAMADTIGLRLGLFADTPGVRALAEEPQLFLTPQAEYKQGFGNVDVYVRGEYTFSLTGLYPQFLFAEERIGFHLPLDAASEVQIMFHNENDFRFNPAEEADGAASGRVQPSAGYGLFLPGGELSLALGTPLDYRGGEDIIFGLEPRIGYISPFWLGLEAAGKFAMFPAPSVDGMEAAVNYAQDQLYGALIFDAAESWSCFSLKVEFDYAFDFIILKGGIKVGNLADFDTLDMAVSVGIKYRF